VNDEPGRAQILEPGVEKSRIGVGGGLQRAKGQRRLGALSAWIVQ
jgi:hypothetical protein